MQRLPRGLRDHVERTRDLARELARIHGVDEGAVDVGAAAHDLARALRGEALLAEGYTMKDIALYGDSAGGGLAISTVLNLRDRGMGMPAAVVLWSPWADITNAGDTAHTIMDADPLSAASTAEPRTSLHSKMLHDHDIERQATFQSVTLTINK